jgi:hypothetical protein
MPLTIPAGTPPPLIAIICADAAAPDTGSKEVSVYPPGILIPTLSFH